MRKIRILIWKWEKNYRKKRFNQKNRGWDSSVSYFELLDTIFKTIALEIPSKGLEFHRWNRYIKSTKYIIRKHKKIKWNFGRVGKKDEKIIFKSWLKKY